MKCRYLISCLLSLSACARSWEAIDATRLPTAASWPDAYAVVLLDEVQVRFSTDSMSGRPVADVEQHLRARVLRDGGQEIGLVVVPYLPGKEELIGLDARSIEPSGKQHVFGLGNAADVMSNPGFILYSNHRARRLKIEPAPPGSVVEYRYTLHYCEAEQVQFVQEFGGAFPALVTRFIVTAPRNWSVETVARRLGTTFEFPPQVEDGVDEQRLTWERRDLAALAMEPQGPPLSLRVPTVSVRLQRWIERKKSVDGLSSARALSAWFHERIQPRAVVAPEERALVKELVRGLGDDAAAKARRLYAWTRDHIQYCAISLGDPGWLPHSAHEVATARYGDCKDKANLLHTLLAEAGIPSRIAALHNHDGFTKSFALPTVYGNFNHNILIVDLPAGPVVVDPTSRTAPFGGLPPSDEEADLLPISPGGSPLTSTPGSTAEANSMDAQLDLKLDGAGDLKGAFIAQARGAIADDLRQALLNAPAHERDSVAGGALDVPAGTATHVLFEAVEPPELPTPLGAHGQVVIPHAVGTGLTRLVRLSDFAKSWVSRLPDGTRQDPVVLGFRKHMSQRFRITILGEVSSLPPPARIDSPFGTYQQKWTFEGSVLQVERELTLRERIVAPAAYDQLTRFFNAILSAEARAATVHWAGGGT